MIAGPQLPQPTWFVGCGNMGRAILDGWRAAGISLSGLTVIRPSGAPIEDVRVSPAWPRRGRRPSWWCSPSSPRSSTRSRRNCAPGSPPRAPWFRSSPGSKRQACARAFQASRRLSARCPIFRLRSAAEWSACTAPTRTTSSASSLPSCSSLWVSRRGWRTKPSWPRLARSPAPGRPMSRASSMR